MRANASFFCLIAVATAITVVFVVPFLIDTGHKLLCIPIFVFLFLLAFYGRCNPLPRHRAKKRQKSSFLPE
jgi:hypothetical protein